MVWLWTWLGIGGCAAPELTVYAPPSPLAGSRELNVRVTPEDQEVVLWVDGVELSRQRVEQTGTVVLDTAALGDGPHEVVVQASRWFRRTASWSEQLVTDNSPPEVILAASSVRAAQGRTLGVFARLDERVTTAEVSFADATWPLERLEDGLLLRGALGVSVKAEPGSSPLEIRVVDLAGNETRGVWQVDVQETAFPKGGYVRLSKQKRRDMNDELLSEQANEARWEAYRQDLALPLVEGLFAWPLKGRITSRFGKVRRYNTGVVRHHLGTDIAHKEGTPVPAAASGTVTLAERLHIYGNVVILKHGPDVSTSYNHLAAITVDVGQEVTQGMMVGRLGSTGQSTGPHLHWGMEVAGVAVAPEEWTERDFGRPLPDDFEPGLPVPGE